MPGATAVAGQAKRCRGEGLEDRGAWSTQGEAVWAQVADRAVAVGGMGATTESATALEEGDRSLSSSELGGRGQAGEAPPMTMTCRSDI